jgi:transposase-like protein
MNYKPPTDGLTTHAFFSRCRWPDGPVCLVCKSRHVYLMNSRAVYYCPDCRAQFSIKKGTPLEFSPLTLDQWLFAIYLVLMMPKITCRTLSLWLSISQPTASYLRRYIKTALAMIPKTGEFSETITHILALSRPQILKKIPHQKPRLKRKK